MKPEVRDTAIREVGCIACLKLGKGFVATEKHHLLTTGKHGNGKRRGEEYTLGLCCWHHRGVPHPGMSPIGMTLQFGPSYARNAREFRDVFGSDDELLVVQNEMIDRWRNSFVGVQP